MALATGADRRFDVGEGNCEDIVDLHMDWAVLTECAFRVA